MKNGARSTEPPQEELATGERSTRNRVVRSVLDHGPSTVSELAQRLGLTQAAVRRHLDVLAVDGIVEARERRVYGARTRGRPAKVFALTDCGRDAFDQSYDELAVDALQWIGEREGGDDAIAAFARARIAAQAGSYREAVEAAGPEERAHALARALTADGYAATARSAPHPQQGEQLCQHHCPVAHAAERFPQLCEAETEFFAELLGTHVQRLATIAHGDGVCTTFIPKSSTVSRDAGAPLPPKPPKPPEPSKPPRTSGTKSEKPSPRIHNAIASASTAGRNPA
ncbi:helix-turn-helix transcriptional regulator [Streptomyces sp. NPDC005774]|uniref:helix-turn-helix transcriptional regulator n=1 Tax=Streptomyces sp. NPDC005774 TaxID=3364728 RepID=UPI0036CC4FE8